MAKQVLMFENRYQEVGWFAFNYVWPPALAFLTSICHCFVYCENLTIAPGLFDPEAPDEENTPEE